KFVSNFFLLYNIPFGSFSIFMFIWLNYHFFSPSSYFLSTEPSSLVLKGGIEKKLPFYDDLTSNHYDNVYLGGLNKRCQDRKEELENIAYEGIVGRDRQAQKGELEKVEIDNVYLYVKYSQDSIIEPVKILSNEKAKELNLKVGILQIGERYLKR
ncbi:MAG: hypothetical protein ACR5LA_13120, partial [Wolbachia sp.]